MIINNKRVNSDSNFDVIYPFTGETVNTVPNASKKQINKAIDLSFNYKCELSGSERAGILDRTKTAIEEQRDKIARLITLETGLSLKNSQYEVSRAINCCSSAVEQAESIDEIDLTADFVSTPDPSKPELTVVMEPWDLAVGITPFNHPLNLVMHKVAPAIAAGTPMVLKPSEKTPLTALMLGEILIKCGLPSNMLNIITGIPPKDIVDQIISCPKTDIVSFTGGVKTGKYIARKMVNSGNELKKYIPELGGNTSFVVMDDCDVELAARIALGAFDNSGQRCTAISKILLHKSIADEFLRNYIDMTSNIRYGDPMNPETDMGTVITSDQAKLISSRVDKALKEGAELLYGNIRSGALLSPTIVDNVNIKSILIKEESFGPVVSILRIESLDDAINYIRSDNFALASAIATENQDNANKLFNNICVGQFSWNGKPGYRTEEAPFGGFKDSGNGEKEGVVMMTRHMRRIKTFYKHN